MSDLPELSGPYLPPVDGSPVTGLVILLHGYGADGHDLIDLAHAWGPHLPGIAFVSPHAPHACDMAPAGRQWFPLSRIDIDTVQAGIAAAGPILEAFLDHQCMKHGLKKENVALMGFSQGGMMALSCGLGQPCAAILSYSGLLADESLPASLSREYPPVLLIHGEADPVVPAHFCPYSRDLLQSRGVTVSAHMRPGLGHGIDQEGLRLGLDFLKQTLSPSMGGPSMGSSS